MRVAVRADASRAVGGGHLSRCRTLASRLHEMGAEVRFVCRRDDAASALAHDFDVHWLSTSPGATWQDDADETAAFLAEWGPQDWLIVDHYGLDARWERLVRPLARRLMVIDDLANRPHDCDVLIDQTFGARETRYADLVPAGCRLLLGTPYALLRPEFASLRGRDHAPPPAPEPIVHVFFGSSDGLNHTSRYSTWLLEAFPGLRVKAAVGGQFEATADLLALQRRFGARFCWQQNVDMAHHMAACQIAVGAPGVATWERACLGLPAVYLSIHPTQVSILEQLAAIGWCRYLGPAAEVSQAEFVRGFGEALSNPGMLDEQRRRGMAAVDGEGTMRVARMMRDLLTC